MRTSRRACCNSALNAAARIDASSAGAAPPEGVGLCSTASPADAVEGSHGFQSLCALSSSAEHQHHQLGRRPRVSAGDQRRHGEAKGETPAPPTL